MQETQIRSLGQEDPLEKEMETHSGILAWEIPRTEEPGVYSPRGHKRVRYDLGTKTTRKITRLPWGVFIMHRLRFILSLLQAFSIHSFHVTKNLDFLVSDVLGFLETFSLKIVFLHFRRNQKSNITVHSICEFLEGRIHVLSIALSGEPSQGPGV